MLLTASFVLAGEAVYAQAVEPVPVIVETDLGNDIDDALALDLVYQAVCNGKIDLKMVSVHKKSPTACAYADILNRWYGAWRTTFEDSFFARLAFSLGEGTAVAESWFILILWIIPYIYWDNMNSLRAFAFLLLLFHAGAMRNRRFQLDFRAIGAYPVLFFLILVLATPLSYEPSLSYRFLGFHVSAALCVFVTVSAVRDGYDLKRLCAGASVPVLASSLYAFFQRASGLSVNISYVDLKLNPDMPGRVYSYFDNPNTFGEVLVLLLPLTLALILCSDRLSSRVIAGVIWFFGVAALLMTYSRAGWVGFALSVGIMVLLLKPALLPLLLPLCCAIIPLLPSAVWTRIMTIFNFSDTTTSSRFPLYEAALEVIRRRPLLGAGLGTDAVKRYIAVNRLYHGSAPYVHAHNLYLQVCTETGFAGLAAFLASMIWNIRRGVFAVLDTPASPARTVTCAAAAGLAGIALCGMADYPWHYPRVMCIFWFLFAMVLAGVKVCRREREK